MTTTLARRIVAIAGTRPEAIKMAPVVSELRSDGDLETKLIVTGQHKEIMEQVLEAFELTPDGDLQVMRPGQSLAGLTARVLEGITELLEESLPDLLIVQGDTTTAFAAALAAFYRGVRVVHVEAGLRTGDITQPFPEEANRMLVARLASLHLAPTPWARENLLAEGIDKSDIRVTGNTVVDALHMFKSRPVVRALGARRARRRAENSKLVVVTTHRRENWGPPQRAVAQALRRSALANPHVEFLVPLHPNPGVREVMREPLSDLPNVHLTEPLSYDEMVHAMARAWVVLTDSGGIQEESCALGVPVLVLREVTERPEGVEAGVMELVGTNEERVVARLQALISDEALRNTMARGAGVFGDGLASERTHHAIRKLLGLPVESLEEFAPVLVETFEQEREETECSIASVR